MLTRFYGEWRLHLFATADLNLLRNNLIQLRETAYFNRRLERYTDGLIKVITHVLQAGSTYHPTIIRGFADHIWRAHKYLSGSVSKEIPYEVVYSLRAALQDWINTDYVITTALTADLEFHFHPLDPWGHIKKLIPDFKYTDFDSTLVQIALPRLYKDKPLFNIPLYHELGHFVDMQAGVSKLALLLKYQGKPVPAGAQLQIELNHTGEFFADLFAACYVGNANCKALNQICPNAKMSSTHPATADRLQVTDDFLRSKPNAIVDSLQQSLKQLALPDLKPRSKSPGIDSAFDDIRPYEIQDDAQLHGIFEAGLAYLENARLRASPPWDTFSEADIDLIVNDLVEKSIRNRSITQKWRDATP